MSRKGAVVALTDRRWFDFLRSRATNGRLDEVNFWRPKARTEFRSLQPGEPFYFRLKSRANDCRLPTVKGDRAVWKKTPRKVGRTIKVMPLWELQTIGSRPSEFIRRYLTP